MMRPSVGALRRRSLRGHASEMQRPKVATPTVRREKASGSFLISSQAVTFLVTWASGGLVPSRCPGLPARHCARPGFALPAPRPAADCPRAIRAPLGSAALAAIAETSACMHRRMRIYLTFTIMFSG